MHAALQAEQQAALEQLRPPLGADGQPMRAEVAVVQDGNGYAYRVHFGPKRMGWWVGPVYVYPREAEAFAAEVNRRAAEVVPMAL